MYDNDVELQQFAPPTTVDLSDDAQQASGAWAPGWYPFEIIEGYTAGRSNYQFTTEDKVSQKGDSRNLRLCFKVTRKDGAERTVFQSYNYRTSDFTPDRRQAAKDAAKEMGRGKWPGEYADLQRSHLAIGKLGQINKATGTPFNFNESTGGILTGPFIGKTGELRLIVNEDGYNDVADLRAKK